MKKEQQSDSSIHATSTHCPRVPPFNFVGLAVPDKKRQKHLMFENWTERKMKK